MSLMKYPNGNLRPDAPEEYTENHLKFRESDPRDMSTEDLNKLGHSKTNIYDVIRNNCKECLNGSINLIRSCTQTSCLFWPYRMGSNPFNRQNLTEEERQLRSERAKANLKNKGTKEA